MWTRLLTVVAGLFWLLMVGLLCWSEFGGQRHFGAAASLETVWEKILTSPDASPLVIFYDGENIGYCKWVPTIVEAGPVSTGSTDTRHLEGMIQQVKGYQVAMRAGMTLPGDTNRYNLDAAVNFSTPGQWSEFKLAFSDREQKVDVSSSRATREMSVKLDGPLQLDTRFELDQLQNPAQLAAQLGGPLAVIALANVPFLSGTGTNSPALSRTLAWTAEYDWMRIENQRVRCYRLTSRILDRHEIIVFVSLVGEIMRVELPGGFRLVNDTKIRM